MFAVRSMGVPARALFNCVCWAPDSIQVGMTPSAWSFAATTTSPPAMIVEFATVAVTVLATALPSADTEMAPVLAPATPIASARMIEADFASSVTTAAEFVTAVPSAFTPALTVEPLRLVLIISVITLAATAPPPAHDPEPAPPTARVSITEASTADSVTEPAAFTIEPLATLDSSTLLRMLTEMPTPAAYFDEPAPPAVTVMICELVKEGISIPDVP